jgi:hypothetical protein
MTAHAAEPTPVVPPMPERNPKALREAIAEHAPQLWLCTRERESFVDGFGSHCAPATLDQCR